MRLLLTLVLCLLCGAAFAFDTYTFPRGIVSVGDTVADLVKRAGPPSRTVELENKLGGRVGERWEYYVDDKLVAFTVQGGRIVGIDEA